MQIQLLQKFVTATGLSSPQVGHYFPLTGSHTATHTTECHNKAPAIKAEANLFTITFSLRRQRAEEFFHRLFGFAAALGKVRPAPGAAV